MSRRHACCVPQLLRVQLAQLWCSCGPAACAVLHSPHPKIDAAQQQICVLLVLAAVGLQEGGLGRLEEAPAQGGRRQDSSWLLVAARPVSCSQGPTRCLPVHTAATNASPSWLIADTVAVEQPSTSTALLASRSGDPGPAAAAPSTHASTDNARHKRAAAARRRGWQTSSAQSDRLAAPVMQHPRPASQGSSGAAAVQHAVTCHHRPWGCGTGAWCHKVAGPTGQSHRHRQLQPAAFDLNNKTWGGGTHKHRGSSISPPSGTHGHSHRAAQRPTRAAS